MTLETTPYPRNDDAVDYALSITRNYLNMLRHRSIPLDRAQILEIGPGADFATQLVLASFGATVTLADRFLVPWDDAFHPDFYRAFLAGWDGPKGAIETALADNGYGGVLRLVPEPAEALGSIADRSLDLVLSNAVLEHVRDLPLVAREMARITRPGGVQAHQVDCRHHRDFSRPLDHLLIPEAEFAEERERTGCVHGTQMRLQEMAECFAPDFWLDEIDANAFADPDYLDALLPRLEGRFARFPRQSLRITGGRLWLSRKAPDPKPRRRGWFALG
jgi:SAM-dependent methyltransferase